MFQLRPALLLCLDVMPKQERVQDMYNSHGLDLGPYKPPRTTTSSVVAFDPLTGPSQLLCSRLGLFYVDHYRSRKIRTVWTLMALGGLMSRRAVGALCRSTPSSLTLSLSSWSSLVTAGAATAGVLGTATRSATGLPPLALMA